MGLGVKPGPLSHPRTSRKTNMAKFAEIVKGELLRIPIPRTSVNKGKQKDLMVQQLNGGGHSDRLLETSSPLTKRDSA